MLELKLRSLAEKNVKAVSMRTDVTASRGCDISMTSNLMILLRFHNGFNMVVFGFKAPSVKVLFISLAES